MRGGAAAIWSSRHIKRAVSSSTEAEYRAASQCTKQIQWAQELLHEVKFSTPRPTKIQIDNQGAIRMGMRVASQHRTSHIRCDEMTLNDAFDLGDILPEYVKTDENPADLLTKPLGFDTFDQHRRTLLGISPPPPEASQYHRSTKLS